MRNLLSGSAKARYKIPGSWNLVVVTRFEGHRNRFYWFVVFFNRACIQGQGCLRISRASMLRDMLLTFVRILYSRLKRYSVRFDVSLPIYHVLHLYLSESLFTSPWVQLNYQTILNGSGHAANLYLSLPMAVSLNVERSESRNREHILPIRFMHCLLSLKYLVAYRGSTLAMLICFKARLPIVIQHHMALTPAN